VKLVELLKRHEGKTLEHKRDLSSPNSILKCLVAFANTGGGIVVIGVEDGSKNIRGVPDVLAAEEKLQTWSPTRSAHASFRIWWCLGEI
jgi:predicted HTH transcriptional regulator